MKPTNSRDGVKRVDLRITHRLAGYDFAGILCLKYREEDELPPDLSKGKILELVRKALEEKPDDRNWWRDDVEEDFADALWDWADALVRKRFPELY